MQCYNPRLAFRTFDGTKIKFTGLAWSTYISTSSTNLQKPILKQKYNTLFSKLKNTDLSQPLKIPCSKCEACLLNRAGETARRAYDEFKTQNFTGMFITLTYSPDNLPKCGHFNERDIVLFVKRLRKISPTIRTLGVAEYGERTKRPHFHLLVLGYEFSDKKILRQTDSSHSGQKYNIYETKTLQNLWPHGISEFGSVTEQSCSYVARYLFKKNKKESHGKPCETCQNEKPLKSKIVCRSRRPGLGAKFCDTYISLDRAASFATGDTRLNESLPRYYIDRVCKKLANGDKSRFTTQPDYTKTRENETKEKINALKIINVSKLKNLFKTKI